MRWAAARTLQSYVTTAHPARRADHPVRRPSVSSNDAEPSARLLYGGLPSTAAMPQVSLTAEKTGPELLRLPDIDQNGRAAQEGRQLPVLLKAPDLRQYVRRACRTVMRARGAGGRRAGAASAIQVVTPFNMPPEGRVPAG